MKKQFTKYKKVLIAALVLMFAGACALVGVASASSIMARATRSFTLPAGFRYSSFARIVVSVMPDFLA